MRYGLIPIEPVIAANWPQCPLQNSAEQMTVSWLTLISHRWQEAPSSP
jgi:hypothetical protein